MNRDSTTCLKSIFNFHRKCSLRWEHVKYNIFWKCEEHQVIWWHEENHTAILLSRRHFKVVYCGLLFVLTLPERHKQISTQPREVNNRSKEQYHPNPLFWISEFIRMMTGTWLRNHLWEHGVGVTYKSMSVPQTTTSPNRMRYDICQISTHHFSMSYDFFRNCSDSSQHSAFYIILCSYYLW